MLAVATRKWTIFPNLTLPRAWILNATERAGLRQFGESVGHLPAPLFLFGLLLKHGDVYAKRSIGSRYVFSRPPDAIAFEDAFVGPQHNDWFAGQ